MKKIISIKGRDNGKFVSPFTNTAIHERIDHKLAYCYKQDNGDDIQIVPTLTFELSNGQLTTLELSYTIDNPTQQRLEYFRDSCNIFFELDGFMIDSKNETPRIYFRATDMFDIASLIHALDYLSVSLMNIFKVVDDEDREESEKEENREENNKDEHRETDKGDYLNDETPFFDEYDVGFSKDGKVLICCRYTFNDVHYKVPDGVEEINDFAFLPARHFVELSIPRSVRIIGDDLFGNGGKIIIRDEDFSR